MNGGSWLGLAIAAEIVATASLNLRPGPDRPLHLALTVAGYVAAFYCLSMALRTIPLGLAYAIWSGLGITALALIGWLVFRQPLSAYQTAGLILIIAGIALMRIPAAG